MTDFEQYKEHIEYTYQKGFRQLQQEIEDYQMETENRKRLPYEVIVKAANDQPEAVEMVFAHYASYIRYVSLVGGKVHVDTEDEVKTKIVSENFG